MARLEFTEIDMERGFSGSVGSRHSGAKVRE